MSVRVPRLLAVTLLALSGAAFVPAAEGTAAADSVAPTTTITFGPEGPTFATRPVFGYQSDDPDAYFECSLDSGAFEFCGPATYESLEGRKGRLADGPHSFSVRAVSEAGTADPTPAVASFIVDTDPPTATILTRPRHFIRNPRPSFEIEVSGEARFRCQILGHGVNIKVPSCGGRDRFTSPRPLAEGAYEFVLVAIDDAVNETEDRVEFEIRTEPGPPPDPLRGSILYTGRGEGGRGVKSISFRLKGRKLLEARVVVVEACLGQPWGSRRWRPYNKRRELEEAAVNRPLRVDRRGRFRAHHYDLWQSSDYFENFAGQVTPRSIVGSIELSSSENQGAGGESYRCHTGPFPGPMEKLRFHAWRRAGKHLASPAGERKRPPRGRSFRSASGVPLRGFEPRFPD
jgi:hypothetical protein